MGLSPGDIIGGRYELVRLLGAGGTGAVFEARHRIIGHTVAIKLLLPELSANPAVPERFLQEARASREVRHRNIVDVLDFGDDAGRLYMVMEHLHGESLAKLLHREAPTPPARILPLLDPIMAALAAAHAQGIVHRDVKPQNIFLAHDDEGGVIPKLIDFGIAKRLTSQDVQLTSTGMILGTPAYMAPEQAQGSRGITGATDQYAIGAILYQALTRSTPISADTYPAMLVALVTSRPSHLLERAPDLDPALAEVVMRMVAYNPEDRFPSMDAAREALKPFHTVGPTGTAVNLSYPPPDHRTHPDGTRSAPAEIPPAEVPPTPEKARHLELVTDPPAPRTAPLPWLLAALGAGASVALIATLAIVLPNRGARAVAAGPSAQAVTSQLLPTTESVTFRIEVEPRSAAIHLDGVLVGYGRAELLRPRDGRRYQLRLSAPEHIDASDVLVATTDARVSRVLGSAMTSAAPRAPGHNAHAPPPQVPGGPGAHPAPPATTPPTANPGGHRGPRIDRHNPFGP
ncbi:MAG: serine/threonine protein kinase [Deltaproteobacteria bacterium]|nr:serine/threonine protein kinase [Deltaproteobacteria bacterium]